MIEVNEDHEYVEDNKIYISVHEILTDCGLIDIQWYTEETAQRGTDIHKMTKEIDGGGDPELIKLDYPEEYEGYIDAYLEFKQENDYQIIAIEKPYINKDLRFAGTPDRICKINNLPCILDIKTGSKCDWHGIQLSGYKMLLNDTESHLRALYLKENGKYKLEPYKDSDYRKVFTWALNIFHWKHK